MVTFTLVAGKLVIANLTEWVVQGWEAVLAEAWLIHEEAEAAALHHVESLVGGASPDNQTAEANVEEKAHWVPYNYFYFIPQPFFLHLFSQVKSKSPLYLELPLLPLKLL